MLLLLIELLLRLSRLLCILGLLLHTRIPSIAVSTSRLGVAVIRIATHRVRSLVMRLTVLLVLRLMVLLVVVRGHLRRTTSSTRLEIDIHSPLVLLRIILQPHFLAYLLNLRLDLLNMSGTMVALPDNHM